MLAHRQFFQIHPEMFLADSSGEAVELLGRFPLPRAFFQKQRGEIGKNVSGDQRQGFRSEKEGSGVTEQTVAMMPLPVLPAGQFQAHDPVVIGIITKKPTPFGP